MSDGDFVAALDREAAAALESIARDHERLRELFVRKLITRDQAQALLDAGPEAVDVGIARIMENERRRALAEVEGPKRAMEG